MLKEVLECLVQKRRALIEYTANKLNVAEDKLDKNLATGIGCYIVFVSNHDGKRLVEHAYVVLGQKSSFRKWSVY